jgi:hypothetical protein
MNVPIAASNTKSAFRSNSRASMMTSALPASRISLAEKTQYNELAALEGDRQEQPVHTLFATGDKTDRTDRQTWNGFLDSFG